MKENLQAVEVKGYVPYFSPVFVFGYSEEEVERYEAIERFLINNEKVENVQSNISVVAAVG